MTVIDHQALKAICRNRPLADALQRVGRSIATDAGDMAARTGDNRPRHIHPGSLNAGAGYRHYDEEIEVFRGMDRGMAATYVLATRHALWLEFGWTDPAGRRHPGRKYLTRALLLHADVG